MEGGIIYGYRFYLLLASYLRTSRSEWGDKCSRAEVRCQVTGSHLTS
jgi:hypothetical protein